MNPVDMRLVSIYEWTKEQFLNLTHVEEVEEEEEEEEEEEKVQGTRRQLFSMALVLGWYNEICLKINNTIGLSTYAQ